MRRRTMVREDGKRNFVLRNGNGIEDGTFSGRYPRQAALKAARRLDAAPSEEAAEREELRLREKGTDRIHVYEAWAWEEAAGDDAPDWVGETVTEANVSKQGIEHDE